MQQAVPVQQGARPISASAGQLYGTDGNPVILKVRLFTWFRHCVQDCMLQDILDCPGYC